MKKIKLLVIFFFVIFLSILIYKYRVINQKEILILGENTEIKIDNYKIKKYIYDNITYKELIKSIKNDEKIIVKNKEISLNVLIANTDYLIINANNYEYLKKCRKGKINKYYKDNLELEKEKLLKLIKKISKAKIIIIKNTCNS